MATKDVQRLRELEKENARLKRLLAERDLELDVLKEALSKNSYVNPSCYLALPVPEGVVLVGKSPVSGAG